MQDYSELRCVDYQKAAVKILESLGIDHTSTLPIEAELVANKLGYEIIPMKNLKRDFGIKGMVFTSNEEFFIGIDEYHYLNEEDQSNFTIGEELGHIVLHLDSEDYRMTVRDLKKYLRKRDPNHKHREQQARGFSSNLILPHFIFVDYVVEYVRQNYKSVTSTQFANYDELLAENIADYLKDEINVSFHIIKLSLVRWPDRAIDRVYKEFPELKKKK